MYQFSTVALITWTCLVTTLISIILTLISIWSHVNYHHRKNTRILIVRILLMAPIYALEAFGGSQVPNAYLYLDAIRDIYEAFVIYSFYNLLIEALGGEETLKQNLRQIFEQPHIFPFNCLRTWVVPIEFINKTRIGVLQYCVVEPICVIITFILKICGKYKDGVFRVDVGYPYIAFIRSCSQSWAIYTLILFYLAVHQLPEEFGGARFCKARIVPKFLCVKGIVFFTFWQSVLIAILVHFNLIPPTAKWTSENLAISLQDFIICIEMVIFAGLHIWAFKTSDFDPLPEQASLISTRAVIGNALLNIPNEIIQDTKKSIKSPEKDHSKLISSRNDYRLPTL